MFKVFIETFAEDFGIVDPEEFETQRREIMPQFVQMDAVVVFPDDFDFTTLKDKTFPFLGKYGALEYKGPNDPLTPMRCYQLHRVRNPNDIPSLAATEGSKGTRAPDSN